MIKNSVVIASTAGFLADMLREKIYGANYNVFVESNDKDLFKRINSTFPRYIFIENCFYNNVTDEYVYKIKRNNQNLHIVIWTAAEITPFSAARFIHSGAESFFSIRDTVDKVNKILTHILLGETYCPADVEKACNIGTTIPIFDVLMTERELQIIKLLPMTDVLIGKELCIAKETVCYHKRKIFRKLGLFNRKAVIGWAIKHGIIPNDKC